jgi:FlaA1/EpsC-like NDP-sugar epimerase
LVTSEESLVGLSTGENQLYPTNSGKTILLTGAGGSIGSALAKTIVRSAPRLLVLLDHSECSLRQVESTLVGILDRTQRVPIVGDICDIALLAHIFEKYRPEIIYHSAAFKHVPVMEMNPLAAVRNNAIGTLNLVKSAHRCEVARLIMISTDKAVNPRSVMGASKRVAELVSFRWSNAKSQTMVLRLGNVLGSQGSVVPVFLHQISQGGPVTVAHPEVTRYFLTMSKAVELILTTAGLEESGGMFLPEMGKPVRILDLARELIRTAGFEPEKDIPIVFTGLRPGDKMSEELVGPGESFAVSSVPGVYRVTSRTALPDDFDGAIAQLADGVHRSDIASILETLCRIVPEYQPSETLLGLLSRSPS